MTRQDEEEAFLKELREQLLKLVDDPERIHFHHGIPRVIDDHPTRFQFVHSHFGKPPRIAYNSDQFGSYQWRKKHRYTRLKAGSNAEAVAKDLLEFAAAATARKIKIHVRRQNESKSYALANKIHDDIGRCPFVAVRGTFRADAVSIKVSYTRALLTPQAAAKIAALAKEFTKAAEAIAEEG